MAAFKLMDAIMNTRLCRMNMKMSDKVHKPRILPAHTATWLRVWTGYTLHSFLPVAAQCSHRKQSRKQHCSDSNNVENNFGQYPDNGVGIKRLPVHHEIT